MKTENSRKIFEKAKKSIPGGVNSPVRAFQSVNKDYPIFIESAKGSRLYDEDGNEYIDCIGSWGPMILGHNYPEVLECIKKEVEKGTLKLKCREVLANFKKLVSSAYAPGTNASTIINDLASKCGFTVKQCELKTDKVYSIGESILGSGLYEIGQIVKDCNSQMTTKNDFIYIYHNEVDTEKIIKLSYQSGLLEEPKPQNVEEISYKVEKKKEEKTTKKSKKAEEKKETGKEELKYDYEVKSLLIYQLKKGDLIELLSNEISTICQIVEISDISDFVMNLKVRVVNNTSDIEKNNAELKEKKSAKNTKGKSTQTKRKGKK